MTNVCADCLSKKCSLRKRINIYLCHECAKYPLHKTISFTQSKLIYLLTKDDLVGIKSYAGMCLGSSSSDAVATYYTLYDIENIASKKYGVTADKLIDTVEQIKNDKKLKRETKQNVKKIL